MSIHKTVLLQETIDGLNLTDGAVVVDGTFGGGGHSALVCEKFPHAKIIALDQDAEAWDRSASAFEKFGKKCDVTFINTNFRNMASVQGVEAGKVDAVILDLGLSTDQLDNSGRGFSFTKDEPLLMTMKANPTPSDVTAKDVVNTWSEESLADIIYGYGEEKQARRIAKWIVDERQKGEINTTFELVAIIEKAIPARFRKGHTKGRASKIHFATKTFQAIRIAVNDELGALKAGLEQGFTMLKVGGRMSVISFHSLEDRVVKRFFKEMADQGKAALVNKKVIIPSAEEIKENNRSRSAKLRIIEKI